MDDKQAATPRKLRLVLAPAPGWERVRAFYRDVLGLEETGGWELPGDRGAFLDAGAGEIEVMEQDAGALGIFPAGASGWQLALEVADLDAAHARLERLGVSVERDIEIRPWGARDLLVRDPLGNPVLLYQEAPPDADGAGAG